MPASVSRLSRTSATDEKRFNKSLRRRYASSHSRFLRRCGASRYAQPLCGASRYAQPLCGAARRSAASNQTQHHSLTIDREAAVLIAAAAAAIADSLAVQP
jgi:hypothetical protein